MTNLPSNYPKPKYWFGDRTKQGTIIGMEIYPPDSYLASQYGSKWYYTLLPYKSSEDLNHLNENQIQPLSPEEARAEIEVEIQHQQQLLNALTKEMEVRCCG